jgi:hypothetical protein
MDHQGLISERDAAAFLTICVATLRGQRARGQLPSGLWVRPSPGRVAYSLPLLRRWVQLGCPPTWPAGFNPAA